MIARMSNGLGSIDRWDLNQLLGESAVPVWKGKYTLTTARNVRVERALPINEVIDTLPEGLFLLVAADARDPLAVLPSRLGNTPKLSSNVTAQWILSTNLGVSAAKFSRGMSVNVRALDTAEPIRYARVDLITQSNDIVFSGQTDKDGVVNLPEPAVKGTRANAPSHLVVRSNRDFSFLVLDHAALDLSALDIRGRALNTRLDAYLFTDRGIYRPRETVHLTGLVRNQLATTADIEDVSLVVLRPNGSVYKTLKPQLGQNAAFSEPLTLPSDAPRGSWRIEARAVSDGATVGAVEIDVQDFIPERLKVTVAQTDTLQLLVMPSRLMRQQNSYTAPRAVAWALRPTRLCVRCRAIPWWARARVHLILAMHFNRLTDVHSVHRVRPLMRQAAYRYQRRPAAWASPRLQTLVMRSLP